MSNERVKKLRAKNLAIGRKRREYPATDEEHLAVLIYLKQLRDKNDNN
jgi:hypothetical protein